MSCGGGCHHGSWWCGAHFEEEVWAGSCRPCMCVCSLRESTQQHATFLLLLSWLALVGALELRLAAKLVWLSWMSCCMLLCHARVSHGRCCLHFCMCYHGHQPQAPSWASPPVYRLCCIERHSRVCICSYCDCAGQDSNYSSFSLHSGVWRCCYAGVLRCGEWQLLRACCFAALSAADEHLWCTQIVGPCTPSLRQ